jgi:hypothetical protein
MLGVSRVIRGIEIGMLIVIFLRASPRGNSWTGEVFGPTGARLKKIASSPPADAFQKKGKIVLSMKGLRGDKTRRI